MNCRNCGAVLKENHKFCDACGMPIPLKDEELLAQTEVNLFKDASYLNELTNDSLYNALFLNETESAVLEPTKKSSNKFYLIMGIIIFLSLFAIICSLIIIKDKKNQEKTLANPPSIKEKPIYKKN